MNVKYQLLIASLVTAVISGLSFWGFAAGLFMDIESGSDVLVMLGTITGFMSFFLLFSYHDEVVSQEVNNAHRIAFQMGMEEAQRQASMAPVSEWHKV